MTRLLFVVLAAFLVWGVADAQIVKQTSWIFNGKTFTTSEIDSVSNISITYTGTRFPDLYGHFPDSVRLEWYGYGVSSADSIGYLIHVYNKLISSASYITKYTVDSIKAQETGYKTLSTDAWVQPGDLMHVVIDTLGVNNPNRNGYQGAKLWLRVSRFFKK